MFDYLRSSYDLGETFTNVTLQTKDIEWDIGGTMTHYWIDPKGVLWCPDYTGTSTLEGYEEGDHRYKPEHLWMNYECIPTGQRGKYHPHKITKYIEVYPERWEGNWEFWPRLRLHFRDGVLQDFENITGRL